MDSSVGQYAGTPGTKTNFGFNVKYNKSGRKLQGKLNLIFRSGGHKYQVKGNAMRTLAVNDANEDPRTAVYTGKANLADITDLDNPISLGGNLTIQVKLTDQGEPGNEDTIGFTVSDSDGLILFSSNWDGTQTAEQLLGGGNLIVH
jgi:hypothetical protein